MRIVRIAVSTTFDGCNPLGDGHHPGAAARTGNHFGHPALEREAIHQDERRTRRQLHIGWCRLVHVRIAAAGHDGAHLQQSTADDRRHIGKNRGRSYDQRLCRRLARDPGHTPQPQQAH